MSVGPYEPYDSGGNVHHGALPDREMSGGATTEREQLRLLRELTDLVVENAVIRHHATPEPVLRDYLHRIMGKSEVTMTDPKGDPRTDPTQGGLSRATREELLEALADTLYALDGAVLDDELTERIRDILRREIRDILSREAGGKR
jgi:hypothetical protein